MQGPPIVDFLRSLIVSGVCCGLFILLWAGILFWIYRDGMRRNDQKAVLWTIITFFVGAIWCAQTFFVGLVGLLWSSVLAIGWIVLYREFIRNRIIE